MIDMLRKCSNCNLCHNQAPLLDTNYSNTCVVWVGLSAKIVFLLGSKVSNFVLNKLKSKKFKKETNQKILDILKSIEFHNIYHPSYIAVYKRKEENSYIQKVQNIISSKVELYNVY